MTLKAPPDRQRLDKWLFFARLVKSRTLAARFVSDGHVRVNGEKKLSPSHPARAGDVLTIVLDKRILILRITGSGTRRGPAIEAQTLYEDISPPVPAKEQVLPSADRDAGSGRPTKRERRAIDRLKPRLSDE